MQEVSGEELLATLLFPEAHEFYEQFKQGRKLVHYTTAENGLNIIRNKEMWMRHSSVMNDFMELEHGTACLESALKSEKGQEFQAWLNGIYPDFMPRLWEKFRDLEQHLRNDTYLTSVAIHDAAEDRYGRLSMWRAYGGRNGVALIVNPTAFMSENQKLGAFSTPVKYSDEDAYSRWFAGWVDVLMTHGELAAAVGEEDLRGWLMAAFRINILATKHPGFAEEQEWRIYHTPAFDGGSDIGLVRDFKTINGVPQPIMKIPLADGHGTDGLSVNTLLHRVIIGPSEHTQVIARAYVNALEEAGFKEPWSMIGSSNIPLRQ